MEKNKVLPTQITLSSEFGCSRLNSKTSIICQCCCKVVHATASCSSIKKHHLVWRKKELKCATPEECTISFEDMQKDENRGKAHIDYIAMDISLMVPSLDIGFAGDLTNLSCSKKRSLGQLDPCIRIKQKSLEQFGFKPP